jgi:hypothetical protein
MFDPAHRASSTLQELLHRLAFPEPKACTHGFHGRIGEIAQDDSGIVCREAAEAEELAPRGQP